MPSTPIGARKIGDGRVSPNRSTDRSRSVAPTNIRGYRPQRSNAVTLARWVCSSPAPPATYDHTHDGIACSARAASSSKVIGNRGSTPVSPLR
jgi:hypothetical protein